MTSARIVLTPSTLSVMATVPGLVAASSTWRSAASESGAKSFARQAGSFWSKQAAMAAAEISCSANAAASNTILLRSLR